MHVLMRIVHVVGVVSASVTFFIAYYALVELPAKEPRYGPPDELLMEQLEPISNEVNIADTMFKKIQTTKQSEDFPNQDVTHTLPPYDVAITNKQIVHNPGYVTKTTVKTLSQKQYLFPVQMWEGGPNWNYKNYRIAMLIALYGKRSVVTIPFHIHHTQPDGWLTHGWRQFNFTYDENKLKQIITLVTPEDFKRECDGKIDFILHNPFATKRDINEFVADYKRTKASFSELWDIQLPGEETIPRDIAEVNRSFKAFEGARCAGVYRAMDFLDILQIPDKSDILTLIDTYTDRVPYIQQLAGHVMPHICDRKAFMVLQWRNKTGE
ncbi:uncharacterized protein LOC100370574, partial [Saccoglossus kowalevskii]|uniref:Uncharacterized protein LOC100370574 n=1 Tax=Saccoglossus kowalevskii TaxID=10224 RepID=A0ABM0MNJ0_SACKO